MRSATKLLFVFFFCLYGFAAIAQATYTVSLNISDSSFAPALQSFCYGQYMGKLLLVGGRTNGFHRTSDKESTFPTQYDNQQFYVIDIQAKKSWSAPVPSQYLQVLRTTNMQSYQDGNILYCCGGYGSTCDNDSASCYQTFPNLTAINVQSVITAITSGQTTGLEKYIISINDERMRVTGGELEKIGDYFYLVFGHNYHTIYKGGLTGIYTEQIRKFRINNTGTNLSISDYQTISTPLQFGGFSQFHRRDLNIFPAISTDGSKAIAAYGGVFTNQAGPFTNPILISQDQTGVTNAVIDTSFEQKFCLYECAKLLLYDPGKKNMYTTLFGGITDYYYDKNGKIIESNLLNFMPFFDHASTMMRDAAGNYTEYPQYAPALPGFIGSNAIFIPAPSVIMYNGSDVIIDYSKLSGDNILVGWIYGGIRATAAQANEFNPTFSSKIIYAVYLKKNNVMPDSLAVTKNAVDTNQLHLIDNGYAKSHPETICLTNPIIWRVVGWIVLAAIIFYMLRLFMNSAICRNDSFDPEDPEGKLKPIKERPYSYARVQLFWWTLIILFCYGFFYAQHGVLLPLNSTVVLLLGGPIAVFMFGKTIDNSQINDNNQDGIPARHQDLRKSKGFLTDILSDNGGISIHRLQAVAFNIIYGIGFLQSFLVRATGDNCQYPFIDFDTWQFVLLGVSAAGYLGVKATENNSSTIATRKTTAINMRMTSIAKNNPPQ